jgi:small subunit ribosomal protein S8
MYKQLYLRKKYALKSEDHLSSVIAQINDAIKKKKDIVEFLETKLVKNFIKILQENNLIIGCSSTLYSSVHKRNLMCIKLKYNKGLCVINKINRVSKPGKQKSLTIEDMIIYPQIIKILSTNKGLMTDSQARIYNQGGIILAELFLQ